MSQELSDEKIAQFQSCFNLFDKDKDGYISSSEIGLVLRALGETPSEADIKRIAQQIDSNGDNRVDFNEFLNILTKQMEKRITDDDIEKAFKIFDQNNDGQISCSELKHVITTIGEVLTEAEVDEMFKEGDVDRNGFISMDEFRRLLTLK